MPGKAGLSWPCLRPELGVHPTEKDAGSGSDVLKGRHQLDLMWRPLTGAWSTGRRKKYAYYRCPNRKCKDVNARKDELEFGFLLFLDKLRPKTEYLTRWKEAVVSVWRAKQSEAIELEKGLTQPVS